MIDVNAQLEVAVDEGEDKVALVLLERQGELEPRIAELRNELENVRRQADDAMSALKPSAKRLKSSNAKKKRC